MFAYWATHNPQCRSPHGERGLKLIRIVIHRQIQKSLPARGAWIEMKPSTLSRPSLSSLPARGAWIEIRCLGAAAAWRWSLPARGAWIEIHLMN